MYKYIRTYFFYVLNYTSLLKQIYLHKYARSFFIDFIILCFTGKRKVHFLLEDGKEMIEEYNVDTNVVVRRAWKEQNNFGTKINWMVEVGDPELKQNNIEIYGIEESSNAVCHFFCEQNM